MSILTTIGGLFSGAKLYIYAAVIASALTFTFMYGHNQYEKGYAAAQQEQTQAIITYQKIVVEKDEKQKAEIAQITSEHTKQIDAIQASKPKQVEKTRVIVSQIPRPDVCNLTADELRDFNEAIRAANGSG